ncbi:uncharacterized protein CEXT_140051, partial [Caerostris extrusa]
MHLTRRMDKYHNSSTLEGIKIFSMIVSIASGISVGVFTILAFFNKQSFSLKGSNYYSSAVFSGICLATSIELYVMAQWYQNALRASALEARATELSSNSYSLRPTTSAV